MVAAPSDVEAGLLAFVRDKLIETGEGTTLDTDLFSSGLDSMGIMQIMIHLEETYGVRVPESQVTRENFISVARLVDLVGRYARS